MARSWGVLILANTDTSAGKVIAVKIFLFGTEGISEVTVKLRRVVVLYRPSQGESVPIRILRGIECPADRSISQDVTCSAS